LNSYLSFKSWKFYQTKTIDLAVKGCYTKYTLHQQMQQNVSKKKNSYTQSTTWPYTTYL